MADGIVYFGTGTGYLDTVDVQTGIEIGKVQKLNTNTKGILLAAAAFVVTICAVIFIIVLAVAIILTQSFNCSDMGRALLALWIVIALVCISSVVAVFAITRRYAPDMTARIPVLAVYGAVILMSYVVFAFGLMVLFNC